MNIEIPDRKLREEALEEDLGALEKLNKLQRRANGISKVAPFVKQVYQDSIDAQRAVRELNAGIEIADLADDTASKKTALDLLLAKAKHTIEDKKLNITAKDKGHKLAADFTAWRQVAGVDRQVSDVLRSQQTAQKIADLLGKVDGTIADVTEQQRVYQVDGLMAGKTPAQLDSKKFIIPDPVTVQGNNPVANAVKSVALAVTNFFGM